MVTCFANNNQLIEDDFPINAGSVIPNTTTLQNDSIDNQWILEFIIPFGLLHYQGSSN